MKLTTMTSIAALLVASTACAQDTALNAQDDAYAQDEAVQETVAQDDSYAAEGYDAETLDGVTDPAYGEDVTTAQTGEYGQDAYGDESLSTDGYAQDLAMTDSPSIDGAMLAEEDAMTQARDEFTQADTDGDGQLSRDEFLATMTTLAAAEAPVGSMDETDDPFAEEVVGDTYDTAETEAAIQDPSEYLVAKFTEIAGDDDAVTLDELEEDRREDFEVADADGDDVLEGDEVQTFAQLKTGQDAAAQPTTY